MGRALASVQDPYASAITPDGRTDYVVSQTDNVVSPTRLGPRTAGALIPVGAAPEAIAITPDGKTAYVTNVDSSSVTPITLATETPKRAIPVPPAPIGIAISPNGKTAYVTSALDNVVTPIDLSTGKTEKAIATGDAPIAIAIIPDGKTAFVADEDSNAAFTVKPKVSGSPTTFNASASKGPTSRITSYSWRFGDGRAKTTSRPTVTHVYAARRSYRVTLTVTDADGASTTQVFTGQTVSRNGGRSAVATHLVRIPRRP